MTLMELAALCEKVRAAQTNPAAYRTFYGKAEKEACLALEKQLDRVIAELTAPPDEDALAVERMIAEGAPDPDPLVAALAEVERLKAVVATLEKQK